MEMMEQKHGVEPTGGVIISGPSPFDSLPEDCISNIFSFTSPRDACICACVSKTFESAVKSDGLWESFLPLEHASLIPQSLVFSSKKEIFFSLCDDHVLIEDGKKSFWLEKSSGKRCIMLSSKEMVITWSVNTPQYWHWIFIPESRFQSIAELLAVCWFEVRARMHTRDLSPGTHYSVYIVFKTKDGCRGLGDCVIDVGVGLVGQEAVHNFFYFVGPSVRRRDRERERRNVMMPLLRQDGWMEAKLGEVFNESCCDEVDIHIREKESPNWKHGLIIQGIEFRPANNP